jgi:hypothetical protein
VVLTQPTYTFDKQRLSFHVQLVIREQRIF